MLKIKWKIKKIEKPICYRTNNNLQPLCLGAKHPVDFAENDCIRCSFYEGAII